MSVDIDPAARTVKALRTLRRSGNSITVSIPPEIIQMAGLEVGDDVEIEAKFDGQDINIRPVDETESDE